MHRFNQVVDQLTRELNDQRGVCGGFSRQLGKKLPDAKQSVRTIIGRALAVMGDREGYGVASIHLSPNWYSGKGRNTPRFNYRIHIKRVYEGLICLGYLHEYKKGVSHGGKGLYLTRYRATTKLVKLFSKRDLMELPVVFAGEIDVEEVIRIQRVRKEQIPTNRVTRDGSPITREVKFRDLIDYEDTDFTRGLRRNVDEINARISSKWIDLELSKAEYHAMIREMISKKNKKAQKDPDSFRPLMLSDRTLYRVFNDEDFQTGGRFYGGWWQEIPSAYRDRIVINGKRTVQLDYSGLHPRILYAMAGESLIGDPYEISLTPTLHADDTKGFRKYLKKAFNAMLNAETVMTRPPRGSWGKSKTYLKHWGLRWCDIVDAFYERHSLISDQFFTGVGAKLQRTDSDIAEDVMLAMHRRNSDIVVLPIHDGFICHHGYESELKAMMLGAYTVRFGEMPIPEKTSEMTVEVTGVPNTADWFGLEEDNDDIRRVLDILDATPAERRLNAFRGY